MISKPDSRLYSLDYDWLWTNPPHNDGSPACLRVTLISEGEPVPTSDFSPETRSVRELVDAWLQTLSFEEPDLWGEGGWAARVIRSDEASTARAGENSVELELWSAGEDVADGIEAATRSLYEGVLRGTDVQVTYEQLPR